MAAFRNPSIWETTTQTERQAVKIREYYEKRVAYISKDIEPYFSASPQLKELLSKFTTMMICLYCHVVLGDHVPGSHVFGCGIGFLDACNINSRREEAEAMKYIRGFHVLEQIRCRDYEDTRIAHITILNGHLEIFENRCYCSQREKKYLLCSCPCPVCVLRRYRKNEEFCECFECIRASFIKENFALPPDYRVKKFKFGVVQTPSIISEHYGSPTSCLTHGYVICTCGSSERMCSCSDPIGAPVPVEYSINKKGAI